MRKLLIVLAAVATLAAEPLTKSERDRGMSELHATRKMFLDAVAGLSEAQWSFKAAPDRWSIAECAEHIALSEDLLFGMATERVMNSPADPSKKAQAKGRDEEILKETADRSKKASAPEALKPSNKFPTRQAIIDHFKASRDKTIEYIQKSDADMRSHFGAAGGGKFLDAYQWILLTSAHTNRHVQQILEVKAAAGYPKK